MTETETFIGIDFGTSGARAIVISSDRQIQASYSLSFEPAPENWAMTWKNTLFALLGSIPLALRQVSRAIVINGTSSTVLICDGAGNPLEQPILYNDDRGAAVLDRVKAIAPADHTVISATSSLAKLLWWANQPNVANGYFLHQADWLAFLLHGRLGISDYHNALKLGYDVGELRYPDWLSSLTLPFKLPQVVAPGTPIAPVKPAIAAELDMPECWVCTGTTDSIAAFLASGVQVPGEAVTSLGSTLVLKLLSEIRVDAAQYGIYSHRLGDLWLVGGASNTGGAVLRQFFSEAELAMLSQQIDPTRPSLLNYYPLLKPGERFPINDPTLLPRLLPRPDDPVEFLQGLLESMAQIEAKGYSLLQQLGATPLARVYTAGGGAKNLAWAKIRSRRLQTPVLPSPQTEAAYGSAVLALQATTA
ncbi:FGGY-family carbohydrate kinase [Phormidium tenue FACHB-886]|nr:FGGY-family carbohydrate kinase [Phormidium tenue FACHB-886]